MSVYSPLEAEQFRLLHISPTQSSDEIVCTLCPYSIKDAPEYTALSYTWSDPQRLTPGITPTVVLNDVVVKVGSNLAFALLQLRRSGHITVWADAICINQDDLPERSVQVSHMSRIYRHASDVFVWLGRAISAPDMEHDLTNVVFEFLKDVLEIESIFPPHTGSLVPRIAEYCSKLQLSPFYDTVVSAWRALLGLDYWRRAWILQEVSVNDNVTIFWGEKSLGWRSFRDVFIYIGVNQQYQPLQNFVLDVESTGGPSQVPFERFRVLETLSGYRQSSLLYNLAIARSTKQTDPRDALYAKLGLSHDGSQIVPYPDYTASTESVYYAFARSFIEKKKSLYIICMSYPRVRKLQVPSWVPDWSHTSPRKQLYQEIRPDSYQLVFRATAEGEPEVTFRSDDKTLEVNGFLYQTISESELTRTSIELPIRDESIRNTAESFIRASIAAHLLQYDTYDAYDLLNGMVERIAEAAASLLSDPAHLSNTCHSKHQQTMRRFEAWFDGVRNVQLGCSTLSQWLALYTTSRKIVPRYSWEQYTRDSLKNLFERFALSANVMGAARRIVMLPNGSIGLIPAESLSGDEVCLLPGCPVPVVLRAVGNSYVVVGECYVDGIMHGEAMSGLLHGQHERKTFCIK